METASPQLSPGKKSPANRNKAEETKKSAQTLDLTASQVQNQEGKVQNTVSFKNLTKEAALSSIGSHLSSRQSQAQKSNELIEDKKEDEDGTKEGGTNSDVESESASLSQEDTRMDQLAKRFTTYKVHQLDWYDVESRIKMICNTIVKPVASIANDSKTQLEKETKRLEKCLIDTEKLNNAVFYNKRRNKNIFHIMHDEVTEIKAKQIQHEKTTEAQIEAFNRQMEDMNLQMSNHTNSVQGFQEQLDQTRNSIESMKDHVQNIVKEMQAKMTLSHTELNRMFKEQVTRQNKLENEHEKLSDKIVSLENVNSMLNERTIGHGKTIEQLKVITDNLKETKQDKSNFQEQRMQIQTNFDEVNKDLDVQLNKIKTMEHFIDKYIPIRVQQLIGSTIAAIASQTQLQRMQNYEMEQYKRLNEEVLNDEAHPELLDLMNKVANDLNETIQRFKALAKSKGIRYQVAAKKKDAIEQKITGLSKDGSSLTINASKSKLSSLDSAGGSSKANRNSKQIMSTEQDLGALTVQESLTELEAGSESERPASRPNQSEEQKAVSVDNQPEEQEPADFSDDEDNNTAQIALNKQALLEWVTVADFTQDLSLTQISSHKFKLDSEELNALIGTEGILKICKVMMYKIGLTYKRMDIYFEELKEEFKKDSNKLLGGLRKDLEHVNEGIQQVHDELESSVADQKKLQVKTEKDVNLLIKSNERMLAQTNQWRQDIQSMAMVQSCQAEYITMQTVLEQSFTNIRSHLLQQVESHNHELGSMTAINNIAAPSEQQTENRSAAELKSKISDNAFEPAVGQAQKKLEFDESKISPKQMMRNTYDHTTTAELVRNQSNLSDTKGQASSSLPYGPANEGFLKAQPRVTKTNSSIRGVMRRDSGEYSSLGQEQRHDMVQYRGIDFKIKQLIDMRSVIHQKIEQLFSSSNLYANIMPVKIFGDLISFVNDNQSDQRDKQSQQMNLQAYMTADKSFESLEKLSQNADERRSSAEKHAWTNVIKQKEQDRSNFLPLVPSLPAMRLPQGLKKPISKYESVQQSMRQTNPSNNMSPNQKKKGTGSITRVGAKSISKVSSIGQVNFRKNQAMEFTNLENSLDTNMSGLITIANSKRHQSVHNTDTNIHEAYLNTSPDVIGTSANNESYLQMAKNRDLFNRKISKGGAGFEAPQRQAAIPTIPSARHTQSVMETHHSRAKKQHSGSMHILMKQSAQKPHNNHLYMDQGQKTKQTFIQAHHTFANDFGGNHRHTSSTMNKHTHF